MIPTTWLFYNSSSEESRILRPQKDKAAQEPGLTDNGHILLTEAAGPVYLILYFYHFILYTIMLRSIRFA